MRQLERFCCVICRTGKPRFQRSPCGAWFGARSSVSRAQLGTTRQLTIRSQSRPRSRVDSRPGPTWSHASSDARVAHASAWQRAGRQAAAPLLVTGARTRAAVARGAVASTTLAVGSRRHARPTGAASNCDTPSRHTKRCPRCAEDVLLEALVCRYCNHEFTKDPNAVGGQTSRPTCLATWTWTPWSSTPHPHRDFRHDARHSYLQATGLPTDAPPTLAVIYATCSSSGARTTIDLRVPMPCQRRPAAALRPRRSPTRRKPGPCV